jgi:hypothetical protein
MICANTVGLVKKKLLLILTVAAHEKCCKMAEKLLLKFRKEGSGKIYNFLWWISSSPLTLK